MAMVTNMKNTDELHHRFVLVRQRRLTGVGEERKSPPLSGPSQGDAAAKVDEDRGHDGGGSSRARAGEQWRKEEDEGERSG